MTELNGGFLKNIMIKMGFSKKWVDLILMCVSTVQYFILHNGHELGPIVPRRGLRQGDPLSPYLFILCAEGLSALIRHNKRLGLWQGCKINRLAPVISHLFCR